MLSDSHGCCVVIHALLFDGAIDPAFGPLTVGAVIDHLKAFIDALPERPILIGHSTLADWPRRNSSTTTTPV